LARQRRDLTDDANWNDRGFNVSHAVLEARPESQGGTFAYLVRRVEAEYVEMPGLSVTLRQAQRLLDIDRPTCAQVLKALVDRGVLKRTSLGRYIRV
jgi:hypothetical protein